MFDKLKKYNNNGSFNFGTKERLNEVCNAPKTLGGVYLVYTVDHQSESLIYIGCSGWVNQDGSFQVRNGGMFDRLVNGKQFEDKRFRSWPVKMAEDMIELLQVKWYVTFDSNNRHIPAYVEALLIQQYFEKNNCLPIWNNEF